MHWVHYIAMDQWQPCRSSDVLPCSANALNEKSIVIGHSFISEDWWVCVGSVRVRVWGYVCERGNGV